MCPSSNHTNYIQSFFNNLIIKKYLIKKSIIPWLQVSKKSTWVWWAWLTSLCPCLVTIREGMQVTRAMERHLWACMTCLNGLQGFDQIHIRLPMPKMGVLSILQGLSINVKIVSITGLLVILTKAIMMGSCGSCPWHVRDRATWSRDGHGQCHLAKTSHMICIMGHGT